MSDDRRLLSEFFINLLSVLFIVAGVYLAIPSAQKLYYIQSSPSWPQAEGQVVSSTVERRWASREDEVGQDYLSRIWFSYAVDGRKYISDSGAIVQAWTRSKKDADSLTAAYPSNKEIPVRYYPQNAAIAVLDTAIVPPLECVRLGLGIVFILFGTVALVTAVFRDLFV